MTIWLDEHFSPKLAPFIAELTGVSCVHIKSVTGTGATDIHIYRKARNSIDEIILLSKDFDIVQLFSELGFPPRIIWVNTYNLTNEQYKELFRISLQNAIEQVKKDHFSTIENFQI